MDECKEIESSLLFLSYEAHSLTIVRPQVVHCVWPMKSRCLPASAANDAQFSANELVASVALNKMASGTSNHCRNSY